MKSNQNRLRIKEKKQIQIPTNNIDEGVNFKNVSFKNKLNPESTRVYNEIKKQNKKIDYTNFVWIGSGKQHHCNILLALEIFAESIFNGNLSFKAVKVKQRNIQDVIRKVEDYNPNKERYKIQKNTYTS